MVINTSLSTAGTQADLVSNTRPPAQSGAVASTNAANAVDLLSSLDPQSDGLVTAQGSVAGAVSFTQTQDALLQNVGSALDQMGQLATAAQSPAATDAERATANQTYQSLSAYVNQVAAQDFNGVSLFGASGISVNTDADGATTTLPAVDLNNPAYAAATSADISTLQGPPSGGAVGALTNVQAALKQLASDRAAVNGNQSQLSSISDRLDVSAENISAATSSITSLEGAQQSANSANDSILNQSTIALLVQGNQVPQSVLSLLPQ